MKLGNKKVLITGASSGIGRQLALICAHRGARVIAVSRHLPHLQELAGEIVDAGGPTPLTLSCDVGDWDQVCQLKSEVDDEWGTVDILVNNAGRGAYGRIESLDADLLRLVVHTNLMGSIYCTRAFLPAMLNQGDGHLTFVSSVLGELPAPDHAVYGATKFALTGLAESLEHELAGRGVGVTLAAPGRVQTQFPSISATPLARFRQVPRQSAEVCAARIVGAMEKGQRRIVTEVSARVLVGLRRYFPRLTHWLLGEFFRRRFDD